MIGSAARRVAAALQEQQRLQHEERMKQHRAMLASEQQRRATEAQTLAKARKAQKAAAAAKAEAEQQAGDGAEGFVAGAAGRDEDSGELYSNYQPGRLREGKTHPDPIVETASLAGVTPPEPVYQHHLHECVALRQISDCQLETVIYANMRFEKRLPNGNRAGFFLGDGAGVGKGRQIAAIIREEHARSGGTTRTLWLSVSNDLRFDAERDLSDVGAKNIKVFPEGTAQLPKGPVDKHHKNGVMFITYSLLIASLKKGNLHSVDDQNVGTRSASDELPSPDSLGVNKESRLAQIVNWLRGRDQKGECLIILDECHKAKNLIAKEGQITQTGKAVGILQDLLPNARVLYSSATGASEPNNLGYMYRLGAAGFDHMKEMIETLTRSGLGAMELFAMGLKATGSYLSRTLSYKGADFEIAKIDIAPEFGVMYDRSSDFWQMLFHICSGLGPGLKRSFWGQFFSAQMRFYRQMLMAAKVRGCAELANKAVAEGMCCVIGLQSTGEANTNQMRDEQGDEMDDFISAPKQILHQFLMNHFPLTSCDMESYELDILQHQVSQAVDAWRVMPSAAQAAVMSPGGHCVRPTQGLTASIPGPANMPRSSPAIPRSPPASTAAATAGPSASAAADDDSDDGLELVGEQSLDEVLAARRQHAERTGQMIDLTSDVNPEQVAATARRLEEESEKAEEAAAQAKLQQALQPLQSRLADAQKELDEAHAAMEADESMGSSSTAAGSSPDTVPSKVEGSQAGTKRRSPQLPLSQPTAKKGRLQLKRNGSDEQSDPDFMTDDASPAQKRAKASGRTKQLVESDEDCSLTSPTPGSASEAPDEDITLSQACETCGSTDNADELLLCDGCNKGYHLKCSSPKMEAVPEGDWFCSRCSPPKPASTKAKPVKSKPVKLDQSDDSDSDIEVFQAVPLRPTARQATIMNCYAKHETGHPKVQRLWLKRRLAKAEADVEQAKHALAKAEENALHEKDSKEQRRIRAAKRSASPDNADDGPPTGQPARVKAEPGTAKAKSSAKQSASKGPRKINKQGGGRDGYAVAAEVLDEDWQDEYEDLADEDEDEEPAASAISPQMVRIRDMLVRLLGIMELPPNPLDQLTDLMGGEKKVAEMTGRKGLLVRGIDGKVTYEKRMREERVAQKMINMKEKEAFMDGRKLIAIISDAASVGISLQADKRVNNTRRRCHLTLELPWSADKAIQQFGRSHRSNQTSAPVYRIVVTDCAGEYRFASSAAKRLQSLGALLSADRRALGAGEDLKTFDVDNKWGRRALERILTDIIGDTDPMPDVKVPHLPESLKGLGADGGWRYNLTKTRMGQDFFRYMRTALVAVGVITKIDHMSGPAYSVQEKNKKVAKFLNRMLAMTLRDQKLLFAYYTDTLDAIIDQAKSKGQYEHGIVNLQAQSIETVSRELLHVDLTSDARTYYSRFNAVHGVSWEAAKQSRDEYIEAKLAAGTSRNNLARSGFYLSSTIKDQGKTGYTNVLLATAVRKTARHANQFYRIQRPHNVSGQDMQEGSLLQAYKKVNDAMAQKHWDFWYEWTKKSCIHGNNCFRRKRGEECYIGCSTTTVNVIHGAVLPIWKVLAETVISDDEKHSKNDWETSTKKEAAKVVRCQLDSGEPIVGLSLHHDDVSKVLGAVEQKYGQVEEKLQILDTAEWERQNQLRKAAAASSSKPPTPAKGLGQQINMHSSQAQANQAQRRSPAVKKSPIVYDIIELD